MIRRQLRPVGPQLAHFFGIRPPDYGSYTWSELQGFVAALPKVKDG